MNQCLYWLLWSLCDNAPSFKDNPLAKTDTKFDDFLLEDTRRMVHQGMLDDCKDYFVSATDLEQAQEFLKPSIQPPATKAWERKRKTLVII